MLKIHQTFFFNTLLLFAGTIIIVSWLSYISLKSVIIEDNEYHLEQIILLSQDGLENSSNLDSFVNKIYNATNIRATVISSSGKILAESSIDKSIMNNHLDRLEIVKAKNENFGSSIRHSTTLGIDFLYVAKRLKYHNKELYLRVSMSLEKTMEQFYSLWIKLLLMFFVFIIAALITTYIISKKIKFDIDQITTYLQDITNKNYNSIVKPRHFIEFISISIMLKNLTKKLSNREKQKRKYTAKLRLINRQRNDILSAISHEFKNPLASIMGYTEALQEDLNADTQIREKFLEKIYSNTEKISYMLDRLALSVKLENEDLKLNITRFNLGVLCADVVSNLETKYKDRPIEYENFDIFIEADKTLLELVIVNILDNSLKYSDHKVVLHVDKKRLHVIDYGIGIDEKHLDKVTSKFYRVQKNTWDNSMGLGLAIVKYILKLHGLKLDIKSRIEKGSEFSFSLETLLSSK
ncbi:MAG: ATP-binding protein [Campylobacterota bacterium]|nr:ATP-binding protein [Campylobacterota bacterium]